MKRIISLTASILLLGIASAHAFDPGSRVGTILTDNQNRQTGGVGSPGGGGAAPGSAPVVMNKTYAELDKICLCPANYSRWGVDMSKPIYDEAGLESGDGFWCSWSDGNSYLKKPCINPNPANTAAAEKKSDTPAKVLPKEVTLALAVDAEFKNEADCKDTIQSALRVTNRLIPAGANAPVTNADAYCKSIFPTANSPAVKVTMASSFTVSSLEECTRRLNTAKGYAVSVKQVVGDKLEEVEEVRPLCETKFLAAGDAELQDMLDKVATQSALDAQAHAQVVKVGEGDRTPAQSASSNSNGPAAPKQNCNGGSWGIADPEHCIAW